ncbi:probable G-protein coupled receptor Mth-like 7 [Drosophila gunungcola]|uniref:Uncharacterized protein n=1 Tax=Drosophila gunungcola TaxID=103775 RepID=A0A9P9YLN9_9MUSC|nr:probable G-protein coupled receptor Mth-like 7 [Drosophila gunungcola]KAI8039249.1 hypothetical protein M5D96_007972 [Drosophila gunungcola]
MEEYFSELIVTAISLVCNVLTIGVYLYVEKLRNVIGKCLISSLFWLSLLYIVMILDFTEQFTNYLFEEFCINAIIFTYNLWNSVISFHLWKTLRSLSIEEPRHQFLKYSAFVWGTTAVLIAVDSLIKAIYDDNLSLWNIFKGIGCEPCFYILLLFLNTANLTMFILTGLHIRKIKKETKRFAQDKETMTTCLNFDIQQYLQLLRIFFIKGVCWILNTLYYFLDQLNYGYTVPDAVRYLLCGFGIIVFVLIILKRSTFSLLMESIRENRIKLCSRAPRVVNPA